MLVPGTTSWPEAIPVVAVALALLFLPGAISALLLRAPRLASIALAPALTTTMVVVIGVISAAAGVPWGPVPLIVGILVLWLMAAGVGALLRRYTSREEPGPIPLAVLAVTGLTALAVALVLVRVSGSPEAFPQQPDTIFHLGAAQWMLEIKDTSVLHGAGFVHASASGFYQAAFHALVATIAQLTGASVVVATSSFVLVIAGVAWPVGMIFLAKTLFGSDLAVTLSAAAASVAFTAYPFLLMGYGVLWPNLFGQTLLPGALALLAVVLSAGQQQSPVLTSRLRAAVLLLATVPALFVAHPNAFVTFLLYGYLMVVAVLLRWAWDNRNSRRLAAVASTAGLVVISALAIAASTVVGNPNMRGTTEPGPELPRRTALFDTLLFAPRSTTSLWVLSALVVAGALVILLRNRRNLWLVAGTLVTSLLFYLNVAVDNPTIRLFTWPWNNQPLRLAAIVVLPASLLVTAAMVAAARLLQAKAGSRARGEVPSWAGAVAVTLVFVLATGGGYLGAHRRGLHRYFHPSAAREWVSVPELNALRALAQHVPPGSVVAENAYYGGTYMYVVSGRHMLFPTDKSRFPGDRALLARKLDKVGSSPKVCAAARRQHVGYAITGGSLAYVGTAALTRYAGVDAVGSSSAFRKIAQEGPYTLYKMVRCASGG